MDSKRLLEIYLRDHLAGSTGGVSLARRMAGRNQGTPYGEELARVADQVERDQEQLRSLMDRLGVGPSRLKQAGAWVAEHAGRIKLNGFIRGYSPLSRQLELEGLVMGVTGKLQLWRSLIAASGPELEGVGLELLEQRAEEQRRGLEELHRKAAREALAGLPHA